MVPSCGQRERVKMKCECSSGVCRVTTRAQKRGHMFDQSPGSFLITVDPTEHLTCAADDRPPQTIHHTFTFQPK